MATTCTATPDWERDGMLTIKNDKTLKRYNEITDEMYHHTHPETCWEFENFENVKKKLSPYLKEGEKIISFGGGGFATPKGFKMMMEYYDNVDKRIAAECDPQEVYWYEYNNHECPINMEGDTEPMKIILRIYGEEIARKIVRKNKLMTVDQLLLKDVKVEGLTYNDGKIPHSVWFSHEDGKAYCMSNCTLYPVYLGDKQYEAQSKIWWNMIAHYTENTLTRWWKD